MHNNCSYWNKPTFVSTWLIIKVLTKCMLIPLNSYSPSRALWLNHVQNRLSGICSPLQVLIRCFTYSSAASSNIFSDIRNWTARREQGVRTGYLSLLQSSCNMAEILLWQSCTYRLFQSWVFSVNRDSNLTHQLLDQISSFARPHNERWNESWMKQYISNL
jgi:hypothetical protein